MKKALVLVLLFLILATTSFSTAYAAPSEDSIERLTKAPKSFNGKYVTLQGSLVAEEVFSKATVYYLTDDKDNMVQLEFSEAVLSKHGKISNYKTVEVSGVFNVKDSAMQVMVDGLTLLEEAAPESQPVTGSQSTIVIMAYFTDRSNNVLQGEVYRQIFNDMNAYYMEVSYGQLQVTGGWYPWVRVDHTVAYYGSANPSWWFIRDAVAKVDAAVDFSQYTKFVFVCAGPNEETSGVAGDIWSARWSGLNIATNDAGGTFKITHGMIVPDKEAGVYGVLGVQAHEYGHELGLPDLYGYAGGVNGWDLMAEGTWNNYGYSPAEPTSYIRRLQGWIPSYKQRSMVYGQADLITLDPLEDATATIQCISYTTIEYTYYLIETRRKVSYDLYLPNERVLVLYFDGVHLLKKAELIVGQSYRDLQIEVQVVKADMENWGYQVYVSTKSWSADTRLTNAVGTSWTYKPAAHSIASTGSYVYVTWEEYRDGNAEIYFKRSINNGLTWEADVRVTNNAASQYQPSVAAFGSYVYLVWFDFRDGNWEIYFKRNENYGGSSGWYAEERLTVNTQASMNPSLAVYGRNVHVVWQDFRDGNYEIYYKRSTDNGLSWGADTRLTFNVANSELPDVAAFEGNVYVAWDDSRTGNLDIFFKRSTNNGGLWGVDTPLTANIANQYTPSIAAYGYDVHVVWTDNRTLNNKEIYYRRSIDRGATWKAEKKLTAAIKNSIWPDVAVNGKTVYVVWQDYRVTSGLPEIYFKDSPDRGVSWTADRILSAQPYESIWPSISVSGDNAYVVWTDYRNAGNTELYFKYRW